MCSRGRVLILGVPVLLLVAPKIALAIPAFARKYETSCQTCHVVYPKLTPFGEAFRRNGYRFPDGRDEEVVKREPISLGQEAYKDVWPGAVWPGAIPGDVPMSALIAWFAAIRPEEKAKAVLGGGSMTVQLADTLGEHFSVWTGVTLSAGETTEVEIERVFGLVSPFDRPYLLFRVGSFEPQIASITSHRMLGPSPWLFATAVRNNQWTLEPTQQGIEASGVVGWGRLAYALGFVEGARNQINTPKDAYGHVAYKLGGMRLDGVGGGAEDEPWRETSLQVGGFGYYGQALIGDPALAAQGDRFYLVGGDANASWRDLNLLVAFAWGRNQRPSLAEPTEEAEVLHVFSQIDYVLWPWLVPSLRFERRKIGHEAAENRVVPVVSVLIRANVRAQAFAAIGRSDHVELREVRGGMSFGF